MIARFFIDRPIFAVVISIIITLAGALAISVLPVAQYPEITPPTVQVSCQYPGANAEVIANTVAAPIEQEVNGVEDMLYMKSQSANDGSYVLTVTFALGTDLDEAMVAVQNRAALAMSQLPAIVQALGLDVRKKSTNMLLAINFVSPDGRYDDLYMSNYATLHVKDELARLNGIGDINFLGQRDYSMRVWLDPDQLTTRDIAASEVVRAIQQQNVQVASGQVGGQPSRGIPLQLTTTALGRLNTPRQFADIVVKSSTSADDTSRLVRLSEVGQVELGAQSYAQTCRLYSQNPETTSQPAVPISQPSVAMGIYQRPGANAIDAGKAIRAKMQELAKQFPDGLEYRIVFDTTPFISESISQVFGALRDAIVLVGLIVLLFLQNWRAAVIPLIAVPVAIVGTFAVMAAIGFSINTLSLFGMVLAIGIVVDDAIVVVENVQRLLDDGHSPKEAARLAMDEVSRPIVAIALVLAAVFVPCAFISGITGEFFRQFAVTIVVSMLFSTLNSLTLSPALAALLLRPDGARRDPLSWLLNVTLGWLFRAFNWGFTKTTSAYVRTVTRLVRLGALVLLAYAGLLALSYWTFKHAPDGFIPLQDKGWLLVNVELPDSASLQRTDKVMQQVAQVAMETEGVAHAITVSGQSFVLGASSPNYGSMFIILEPFKDRKSFDLNGLVIFLHLRERYPTLIKAAEVSVFPPPPVNGLGATGGFNLMVEDRRNRGPDALKAQANTLVEAGQENPKLAGVMTLYRPHSPQVRVDIDRSKARSMGVSLHDVSEALEVYMGSLYVNNFNLFGRSWQVNVQADADYRFRTQDIGRLHVRNDRGKMVPLSTLIDVHDSTGPTVVTRYNLYPSAEINGRTQLGVSSGEAITIMNQAIQQLDRSALKTEWTSLSYLQVEAGNKTIYVFGMAIVFVFLVLAGLYESWSLPAAILMTAPFGLLFAIAGVWAFPYMSVGIFTQIGIVVLVGLACKNAILIVEFAEQEQRGGKSLLESTINACHLRVRPIIMTSMAFVFGVVPLIVEGGAGAEMRRSLGVAVFCGMLGVTLFGIFFTPAFYYLIRAATDRLDRPSPWLRALVTLFFSLGLGTLLGTLLWRISSLDFTWALTIGLTAGVVCSACRMAFRRERSTAATEAKEIRS